MAIPVKLEDARLQLQLDVADSSRDRDIAGYIADAAAWVGKYTGHILVANDVTEHFCGFRPPELRAWPIAAGTVPGIAYLGDDGAPFALIGARIDVWSRPARIVPATGTFFPFRAVDQRFTVTVRAGYEDDQPIPGNFRRAMLILISAYDADREGGDVFVKAEASARRLCGDYRLRRL